MYRDRLSYYESLEAERDAKLIVYVTGDRNGLQTQIHPEVLDFFANHLDAIGNVNKITLFLYSSGGQTLAAWSIVNLLYQYCRELEVIVPAKALSAGTLICIGADRIIMTKQGTLGPIDPSVNTPLNPSIPDAPPGARTPVSVEAINGYIELAKDIGIKDDVGLTTILKILAEHVHPLVLGQVYITRSQIRMLGRQLLLKQMSDENQIEKVVSFLCSESGSHDYTIFRQEAREKLGLKVIDPSPKEYEIIRNIYIDIAQELSLSEPYSPEVQLGDKAQVSYKFIRALIESVDGGAHQFVSQGYLSKQEIRDKGSVVQTRIVDNRKGEGWLYDKSNK